MATISVRPTNGVSFGVKHLLSAQDAIDGSVSFDFRIDTLRYDLVASVVILSATNLIAMPVDLAITYPEFGVITLTGTLVAGSVINLVAQRANPAV
jgi:hypothetical protein